MVDVFFSPISCQTADVKVEINNTQGSERVDLSPYYILSLDLHKSQESSVTEHKRRKTEDLIPDLSKPCQIV